MPSCNALATEHKLFVTLHPGDGCLPAALQIQRKGAQNTSGWKFLPTEPYGHKQITLWAAFINNFQICSSWSVGSFKTRLIYFLQPWKGGISWNPNARHISLDLSKEATCLSSPSHSLTLSLFFTEITSWGGYWRGTWDRCLVEHWEGTRYPSCWGGSRNWAGWRERKEYL